MGFLCNSMDFKSYYCNAGTLFLCSSIMDMPNIFYSSAASFPSRHYILTFSGNYSHVFIDSRLNENNREIAEITFQEPMHEFEFKFAFIDYSYKIFRDIL